MQVEHFPGLDEDGLTVTYSRAAALEREDFVFLTWDHPLVAATLDLVIDESLGQANVEAISSDQFPKNVILVEALYTFDCLAHKSLNVGRYLPSSLERYLLGSNRKDYTASLPTLDLESTRQKADFNKLKQALKGQQEMIGFLLDHSQKLATAAITDIVAQARETVALQTDPEIERLEALRQVNPSVRQDEIDTLRMHRDSILAALNGTRHELVAIRVMFNI